MQGLRRAFFDGGAASDVWTLYFLHYLAMLARIMMRCDLADILTRRAMEDHGNIERGEERGIERERPGRRKT